MRLSTLKRDFLAVLPVIGPHSDIEAELLLAGKKPIGGPFAIFPDGVIPNDLHIRKDLLDRVKLDNAVKEGRLRSFDIEDGLMRLYCQPERFDALVKGWSEDEYIYGEEYGYRNRDILFFNWYADLPNPFRQFVAEMNAPIQRAYRHKLLEECGIEDPDEYMRNVFRQLREMDQEKPDPVSPA